jgi:hypothetical protein
MVVREVPASQLHKVFGFRERLQVLQTTLEKPLADFKMEVDDAPIFRYMYRNFKPRRHLEFGTWEGTGVLLCLEECDATVWTMNLLQGERRPDGTWAYGREFSDSEPVPEWANKQVVLDSGANRIYYQTDSRGFIGRHYLEKDLGHRVCQIYCDSRNWDSSNFPPDFFDSVFIDGGHTKDVVLNDTIKGLAVLRPGGLILWHDFYISNEPLAGGSSPLGVVEAIQENISFLKSHLSDLFWINPSWILVGVRKGSVLQKLRKTFSSR